MGMSFSLDQEAENRPMRSKEKIMDYEEIERQVAVIAKENEKYLDMFEQALKDQNLSSKTIIKHLTNMDLYLNDFLCYEAPTPMQDGCIKNHSFFTWFYPRKCLFSSKTGVKEMMASLKKFYKLMLDKGFIEKDDYEMLIDEFKEYKDEYLSFYDNYDSMDDFW